LLAAAEYIITNNPTMTMNERKRLRDDALRGSEIVDATARICAMNLLLHGIGHAGGESLIRVDDSLRADSGDRFSMVLTNRPFGKKSSFTVVTTDGETEPDADRTLSGLCLVLSCGGTGLRGKRAISSNPSPTRN
jgi:type I restriction enzyme M protein